MKMMKEAGGRGGSGKKLQGEAGKKKILGGRGGACKRNKKIYFQAKCTTL